MIITQTHKRRNFVGSMNVGTDLVLGLKTICVDNTIFCAQFTATGYLKDVKLQRFDGHAMRYRDAIQYRGTFHAVGLHGNVSLAGHPPQTVVHCHVVGTVDVGDGSVELVSGELVNGEVVSVEFTLATNDDIRLYRDRDTRTGLDSWLRVEFGDGPLPNRDDELLEVLVPVPPVPAVLPKEEAPAQHEFDITEGDYLHHPTLGRCEVVAAEGDERLSIRLESGRVVEVHLGLLELTQIRAEGKHRIFKVTIKRRR